MTTFLDPVLTGTINIPFAQTGSDKGVTILSRTVTLVQNGATAVSSTFLIPKTAQIVDIISDTTTVWNSGSSDTLSVGTAAAGTQYASGVSVAATGRVRPTFTAAQLLAMSNVGSNTTVVVTVTPSGTTATTGSTTVTFIYIQTPNPTGAPG